MPGHLPDPPVVWNGINDAAGALECSDPRAECSRGVSGTNMYRYVCTGVPFGMNGVTVPPKFCESAAPMPCQFVAGSTNSEGSMRKGGVGK